MTTAEKKQLDSMAIEVMKSIVANNEVLDGIASESESDSDVYKSVANEAYNLAQAMIEESKNRN